MDVKRAQGGADEALRSDQADSPVVARGDDDGARWSPIHCP